MSASKATEVQADLLVENHGSLFLVRAGTEEGGEFLLRAAEDAQYFGGALVVEPRYARGVVELAQDEGLVVR